MVAAGSGGQERSDRGNNTGGQERSDRGNDTGGQEQGDRAGGSALNYARRLGILDGQVVQELGWDEDTDDDIRADIEDECGGELLDEDADDVVDVVVLWWRDGDGDLVDRLMDAITPLADDGVIWVVTPKTGKPGHVMPAEIAESAPTAGLMQTSSANLGDWSASRLVQPKSKAAGRR